MKIHINIANPEAKLGQLSVGDGFIFHNDVNIYIVIEGTTEEHKDTILAMCLNSYAIQRFDANNSNIKRVNIDVHVTEYYRRDRRDVEKSQYEESQLIQFERNWI